MLSYVVPIDVYRPVDLLHHFHLPGDEPDGFVKVFVDDTFKYSTRCINNDRNPKWQDRRRVVDIVADRSIIRLHVYDSDSSDNSTLIDPIGFVEFCIGDIPFDHAAWLHCQYIMCFTNMFSGYKIRDCWQNKYPQKGHMTPYNLLCPEVFYRSFVCFRHESWLHIVKSTQKRSHDFKGWFEHIWLWTPKAKDSQNFWNTFVSSLPVCLWGYRRMVGTSVPRQSARLQYGPLCWAHGNARGRVTSSECSEHQGIDSQDTRNSSRTHQKQ